MLSMKIIKVILSLLSLNFISYGVDGSEFSKEKRMSGTIHPVKLDDRIFYFSRGVGDPVLTTIDPYHEKCILPQVPASITALGNNKLVFSYGNVGHFKIFEFKNCSSYSLITIDDGKAYDELSPYHFVGKLESVVARKSYFDIFDRYQKTCMPCRYNDEGERVKVGAPLTPESMDDNSCQEHQTDGYFIEPLENAFGVYNGYLYGFKFNNYTTVLKVLDSKYNVVKQRLFERKIETYSLTGENLTVCYKLNDCIKGRPRTCQYVECQLLDSNLKSTATAKLHQVSDDYDRQNIVNFVVRNLPKGGTIVAMEITYDWSKLEHSSDVFIQQIHPDGCVEPPIKFDTFTSEFLYMYDMVFDNGEYCLTTALDLGRDNGYTVLKCMNPK